jgi:hypothetical protein
MKQIALCGVWCDMGLGTKRLLAHSSAQAALIHSSVGTLTGRDGYATGINGSGHILGWSYTPTMGPPMPFSTAAAG